MIHDDTGLITVDCPREGCENRCSTLVPAGATVLGTTPENDDWPDATGKVRVDCSDHRFYVHFVE